jgi:small conductance mechanosensitive channel
MAPLYRVFAEISIILYTESMVNAWLMDLNQQSFTLFQDGLFDFFVFTLIVLISAFFVIQALQRFLHHHHENGHIHAAKLNFLKRTSKSLVLGLALFIVATKIIPLNNLALSLLASSGIAVIVIGFAAQETFSNLISGFFISLFRPFELNDVITLVGQNIVGTVEDITMRHTVIRTFENNRVVVPNSIINKTIIENRNLTDERACRFLSFSIAYSADLDLARSIILDEAHHHPLLIDVRTDEDLAKEIPQFRVLISNLSDSSVELRIAVWARNSGDAFQALSDLRENIKKRFDREGIEIPFPTQTVYVKQKAD